LLQSWPAAGNASAAGFFYASCHACNLRILLPVKRYFRKNMGRTDRIIRVSLAVLFFALYYTDTITGVWGLVLLVLGIAFVTISLFSFCPFYPLLGVNTCRKAATGERTDEKR
jgi:hypothetical protein